MRNQKRSIPILLLAFVTVCPIAQAVFPEPDGGYQGGNTAVGQNALLSLSAGTYNTAVGLYSLLSIDDGQFCTGVGAGTLLANTGGNNTGTGAGALLSNTNGASNTADGAFALFTNSTGDRNTAIGWQALFSNTTGAFNSAVGVEALSFNATGNFNIALGVAAGTNVTTANNVICIGSGGADLSDTTWIGNIYGRTTQSGTTLPVVVSDAGQLGTASSSRRFKREIKPMENASESILALNPVTFQYKADNNGRPQFGLIAEEVAKVNPALVVPDKEGKPFTVRYDAVNAMLLNEFLKEHRLVEEQGSMIAELQKQIHALTALVKEQTAQIQKVNAHLPMDEPVARVVANESKPVSRP